MLRNSGACARGAGMKHASEYRDPALARGIAAAIARTAAQDRRYEVMEFCGGHTHTICRYGIVEMLPANVRLVHGPGCPVCVLPIGRLDQAIAMARQPGVVLCAFGDMMRVPASDRMSLLRAKAAGAGIRMVYSAMDALALAQHRPEAKIVFFAIGFETTAPATALAVQAAARAGVGNFFVFCNHVTTPAAIDGICGSEAAQAGRVRLDGIIGPGHVSAITGTDYYATVAARHRLPIVVAGFEPLDLLQALLMVIRQVNEQRAEVENQYTRAVTRTGNGWAQAAMRDVFVSRPAFDWRGLGEMPESALALAAKYADFDAERHFPSAYRRVEDHPACACPDILRGTRQPLDCRIFGTGCTPESPVGACMVSPEGACAAYYQYGRHRLAVAVS